MVTHKQFVNQLGGAEKLVLYIYAGIALTRTTQVGKYAIYFAEIHRATNYFMDLWAKDIYLGLT